MRCVLGLYRFPNTFGGLSVFLSNFLRVSLKSRVSRFLIESLPPTMENSSAITLCITLCTTRPRGRVVHKVMHRVVAPELLTYYRESIMIPNTFHGWVNESIPQLSIVIISNSLWSLLSQIRRFRLLGLALIGLVFSFISNAILRYLR